MPDVCDRGVRLSQLHAQLRSDGDAGAEVHAVLVVVLRVRFPLLVGQLGCYSSVRVALDFLPA